jgi:isopenicillin N synthase-like dioxygenase
MSRRDQQRGVRARNQEFKRFEQVDKPQDYHLSEQDGGEAFDTEYQIQTCDMQGLLSGDPTAQDEFAAQLGKALEGIGFAILTGHGIDPLLYEETAALTAEFFETTTEPQRLRFLARRQGSVNQGYFPIRETTIIHPDLVQGWVFCRRAFDLDGDPDFDPTAFWPGPQFEPRFRKLVKAQEKLILPIMQSLLRYLDCDPGLYDQRLAATNFGFRLNYYPPLVGDASEPGGRMLGHEDVDLFTFLPAPEVDGLQVLNRHNMKWIRLQAPPGSIILNTGDYMQRVSNDIFPSTTHRVSLPADSAQLTRPRVSFPMAIYLWEDEVLDVLPGTGEPKYPPVRAIEFHTAITSKYYGETYAVRDHGQDQED